MKVICNTCTVVSQVFVGFFFVDLIKITFFEDAYFLDNYLTNKILCYINLLNN